MEATEDDDLELLRASVGLVDGVNSLLQKLLWKTPRETKQIKIHRLVKERDLDRLILKIEPFQEDPQLLDTRLKHIIPQLVSAYLESPKNQSADDVKSGCVTIQHAICKILYTFCKVRGEKIIVGFLNNEPRYVEPLLAVFERGTLEADENSSGPASVSISWEERFVLLLWLSHLMLAPFDLSTISSFEPTKSADQYDSLELPSDLPGIPLRIVPICFRYLQTATKERTAAAQLLVRLCLRPDMRKVGLLDAVAKWALSFFSMAAQDPSIHRTLGILSLLSGILASGNQVEIGHFIGAIFKVTQSLMTEDALAFVRSSAVARKIIVKMLRNIVIHCLKAPPDDIDTTEVLEDVIGTLLELLADGDTPVRYAASKALSVLTLQLEPGLATDVIEAILGSLTEDVLWDGSSRNLAAVNPLRWHGLTLTLGHLLYRRTIPTQQLPEILNALLLALTFEQRSATGSSVGTNVRDAANFGIWSISRRYTTKELLAVETSSIRAARDTNHKLSITQLLAIELIESACLDPAGNIRRGSSAALQELIGRHPDTIIEGIPLVQIVDFHAVGLRQRALTEVAFSAAQSSPLYWNSLFHALLGWRGIAAVDSSSRVAAATAIGSLSSIQDFDRVFEMINTTRSCLKALVPRQIEERHGLMMALAEIIRLAKLQYDHKLAAGSHYPRETLSSEDTTLSTLPEDENDRKDGVVVRSKLDLETLIGLWSLFQTDLTLPEKDFTSPMMRPELTAAATLNLMKTLSEVTWTLASSSDLLVHVSSNALRIELLQFCLIRSEDAVLQEIPDAVWHISRTLTDTERQNLVNSWLSVLGPSSRIGSSRSAGRALALGSICQIMDEGTGYRTSIIDCLTSRCTTEVGIEERVIAIRSLIKIVGGFVLSSTDTHSTDIVAEANIVNKIVTALLAALDDYTINERGDVGSLVRLEALELVEKLWHYDFVREEENGSGVQVLAERDQPHSIPERDMIRAAVLRLSLEKLDKVRMRAAQCWSGVSFQSERATVPDVSSYEYFFSSLALLRQDVPTYLKRALLEGYISSAGMGSESIVQASRLALYNSLDELPLESNKQGSCLFEIGNTISEILRANLTNDRVSLPLLEVIAFTLDADILQRLARTPFKWRTFLSLVQKAHYKSNNMQKLHFVLDVYRGLADVPTIRADVLAKVSSMLLHPFPKIRSAAAETLYVVSACEELTLHDWAQPTTKLKEAAAAIKRANIG